MNLLLDLRHTLRLSRKNAGFVTLCVLVVGVGLALSILIYSIVSNIAYSTLPFPNGDKFVVVQEVNAETGQFKPNSFIDGYTYQYFDKNFTKYQTFGAYRDAPATLSDGEVAQQVFATDISANILTVTQVQPILGRSLQPSDNNPEAPKVALLSYRVWQNYYNGDENIVGSIGRINGAPHTIVGVMPEGFAYPYAHDLWLPLQLSPNLQPGEVLGISAVGVLDDGESIKSAGAEVMQLAKALSQDHPEVYGDFSATLNTYTLYNQVDIVVIHVISLLALVLLVLVCLNITNLLLVRSNERLQELAIRSAIGASPWSLLRTILLDAFFICLLGAVLGLCLTTVGLSGLRMLSEEFISGIYGATQFIFWINFEWDLGTAIAAVVIFLTIWFSSAGLAVWKTLRQDFSRIIGNNAAGTSKTGKQLTHFFLVNIELTSSCFLLILCGVSLGFAYDLTKLDFGTQPEGYLTGHISLPVSNYPDIVSQLNYQVELRDSLQGQAGVEAVAFTTDLPGDFNGIPASYTLEDRSLKSNGRYPAQEVIRVSENYFDVLEIPLLAGRHFEHTDNQSTEKVVIVDELFAQRMWPGNNSAQAAINQRIQLYPEQSRSEWLRTVGVTRHVVQNDPLTGKTKSSFYRPISQEGASRMAVVMKTTDDPLLYQSKLQQVAKDIDRDIPITRILPLTEVIQFSNAYMTFINIIFSNFAIFTVILSITGIYAIIARSVWQRCGEIGVRRAIGSSNAKILWVFIYQGVRCLVFAMLIGGGLAVTAVYSMDTVLVGIIGWIPVVIPAVTFGLGLLVVLAAYNPAQKLVTLEPGDALRYE